MNNQNSERTAKKDMVAKINAVEGFDPEQFAVDYTDNATGEKIKRLPVMAQMAWFRLRHPEGKIAVRVVPAKDCFVATARVYPSYNDDEGSYLSEATASRGFLPEKPSISPREWAQTAAVGIALRNAGFGLQFHIAGDAFPDTAPNELGEMGTAGAVPEGYSQNNRMQAAIPEASQGWGQPQMEKAPAWSPIQENSGTMTAPQVQEMHQRQPQMTGQGQAQGQNVYQPQTEMTGQAQEMYQPQMNAQGQMMSQTQTETDAGRQQILTQPQAGWTEQAGQQIPQTAGGAAADTTQNAAGTAAYPSQTTVYPRTGQIQSNVVVDTQAARPQNVTGQETEDPIQRAMNMRCPIKKYADKTLGELAVADPKALTWIANSYKGSNEVREAAKAVCEYALDAA